MCQTILLHTIWKYYKNIFWKYYKNIIPFVCIRKLTNG